MTERVDGARVDLGHDDLRRSPIVAVGSLDEVCETLLATRATYLVGTVTGLPPRRSRNHWTYHMVMARKQVLVQLDDELVARLDVLASALGTNRSDLVRRGVLALLEAAELDAADRALQDAYRRLPQDPALLASARRLAAETSPAW